MFDNLKIGLTTSKELLSSKVDAFKNAVTVMDKAQAAVGIALVVTAITIFIGILIVSEVARGINRSSFTTAQNATFTTTLNNALTGFSLLGIAMIVLGAVAILRFVGLLGGGGGV